MADCSYISKIDIKQINFLTEPVKVSVVSCRVSPKTLEDFISFLWTEAIFPRSLVVEQVTNESRFLIFKLSDFAALVGNLLKTIKVGHGKTIAEDFVTQCHKFQ